MRRARQWGVALTWVADSEPHDRFTLYTRGNTGEVFPNVITALTGTLIGESVRKAQVDLFLEVGVLRPHEVRGQSVGTGVFGGYLYGSGSCMRLFGERMPGMNATTGDEQVFGVVEEIPPYVRVKGDRNLLASLHVSLYTLGLLRRPELAPLDAARQDAQRWLATMPDLAEAPSAELLDWIRTTYPPRIGESMKRLLRFSMMATAPRTLLDRVVDRAGAPPGLANRIVGGTGDIDSAQLATQLWTLGRLVRGDAHLTAEFDAGLDGIAERTSGTRLTVAVEAFLRDHGHRGNDEYELATPSWSMDPTPVYASVDRLRHVPEERDPVAGAQARRDDANAALAHALRIAPRAAGPIVRRAAEASRLGSIGRERAKDVLVLENFGARRVLHELARRAAARGGPQDVQRAFCVTIDELTDFVHSPADFTAVIEERAALARYLNDRVPPAWFDGRIPDPSTWPLRTETHAAAPPPGSTITGIAVNGGTASGPARVVHDPADPRGLDPGEVLVCAITDPSWTPLFLGAAAVVCETGAMQSHAAIVSRELGIPAVLSVPRITAVTDGTMLHVDGNSGEVRVG